MKRVINGKAYNTRTAQKIAQRDYSISASWDLYRTKGGYFFTVDTCMTPWGDEGVLFTPISYDQAFQRVCDPDVELLVTEGIFPSRR